MNQPFLSVIVPCYNVEKYVDQCISSIVNQTYSNLEILLIDDGSTDETGIICDTWQERDTRIRVIHKQNEGVSYARKTGVENATTEYVTFVDADDWMDANMYTNMMSALLSTNSDIVQCGICYVFEDGRMEHRYYDPDNKTDTIEIVGRTEGVLLLLEEKKWAMCMWNKIFKKHLFDHIVFPKGRIYAEDNITYLLFHHAEQSVYVHCSYCYYRQRNDSICNDKNIVSQLRNHRDFSDACWERYLFTKQHPEYHRVLPIVKHKTIRLCLVLIRNMIACPQYFTDEYFKVKVEQLRSIPLTLNDMLQTVEKFEMYMIKISPKIYKILRALYIRIIHVTNKLKITNKSTIFIIK